ncbi:rRNA small subunit methyltransferase B [Pseudactinotalea sp. HY160]|uniref:RsmB/NOP family class I SAM-dependent RNA methyltransferase n=1 Tax=Pseudactinotalea sp. HY160 TaxID=2654490 RepID=UPI00128C7A50|nr:RsmB/NOP family class I SAM-dependent RNA methyltransferase [Pseudactinotalea sp. HY160]MPV49324.1 rRNA small subunit methyltransferase B [Pseudactinotalea sp. HY160]
MSQGEHSGDFRDSRAGRPPRRRGGRAPAAARSGQRPRERSRTADPARLLAYEVLRAVAESDSYANLVLPPLMHRRGVYGRDAAFTTELTYGTLRLHGRYDPIIAIAADRDIRKLDDDLLDVLRLGCHQLLAMRVPSHAAVSETVALARTVLGAGRAQLVNAVLRRVSERGLDDWLTELADRSTGEDERLARLHSHPQWIVRSLRQALDGTGEELVEALEANNSPAEVTLVIRPGLTTKTDLPETTRGRYAPTARVLRGGDPGALSVVREGLVGVQDEGSQLVTLALATTPIEGPDRTWLDLCAGPGGKAALLASWLGARTGGPAPSDPADHPHGQDHRPRTRRLVANELFHHRADLVRASLRAIPDSIDVEVRTGDGRMVGEYEPQTYDRVLVDAPCTGLGALRRRPEARWRRSTADLASLAGVQRELVISAIEATRIGGVVGYVTCSPHVAETTFVIADVIKRAAKLGMPVEVVDAAAALAQVALTPLPDQQGPYVQLWPHRHGTDAMFLAILRRV